MNYELRTLGKRTHALMAVSASGWSRCVKTFTSADAARAFALVYFGATI